MSGREEQASPLQAIKGIGPAWALKLEAEGVGLREIADANEDDIDRWDTKIGLRGKIREQDWRGQAIALLSKQVEPVQILADGTPVYAGERSLTSFPTDEMLKAARDPMAAPDKNDRAALEAEVTRLRAQLETAQHPPRLAVPGVRRPRRLNKNRKYSETYGRDDEHPGSAFTQVIDGVEVHFDNSGVEVGAGISGQPDGERDTLDPKDVHFFNWLDGKVQYTWELLHRAIKQQYPSAKVRNEKEARGFLHGQLRQNY